MLTKAPSFWWKKGGLAAISLAPLSWLYGAIAGAQMRRDVEAWVDLPVVCIGNFTAGGTGKTPLAECLARHARTRGLNPGFVLRGFGGRVRQATLVEKERHTFLDVGDEALMLSETAPVAVSPARADAARLLKEIGVDFIIMDDGLQSGKLGWDFSISVVDVGRGLGNGRCIPAGPLRAPMAIQIVRTDMVILNGESGECGFADWFSAKYELPLARVHTVPAIGNLADLSGRRVLAFAGIGNPEKFFETLRACGADIVKTHALSDHQAFSPELAASLLREAQSLELVPVTTTKDYARLQGAMQPALIGLREQCQTLPVATIFEDKQVPDDIIDRTIDSFRNRTTI
ncbi:tetraacyldisaccharide 4'-kinase [Martelella mediterranea]|uniref:Tetraacyldisaccharide 4'-kinase n=1 Tax=Martelella mediterranea TaxID=293089 RepID=A0A4R3NVE5_9HYPH|nr:tetraacyldisaccharide 4'-kinase [Martelella mediterranea]TCT40365.1 lipid-A-disaccharide kinase [Martelella mediterranea]